MIESNGGSAGVAGLGQRGVTGNFVVFDLSAFNRCFQFAPWVAESDSPDVFGVAGRWVAPSKYFL